MGSFSAGLKKNIQATSAQVNSTINTIVAETFNIAVRISPTQPDARFAKGQFINNWFPAIDGYDNTVTYDLDFSGAGSLSRIESMLATATAFLGKDGFISLSNNLDYAIKVESLGWEHTGPYAPAKLACQYTMSKYSK